MKAISFDTRHDTAYDDDLVRRYHFPNRYLSDTRKYVGDWIVYREPQRLMDKHELADWTLAFTESGRRLSDCNFPGSCDPDRPRLCLGGRRRADPGHHAARIVGPEADHGPLWKATARRIGATPEARNYETRAR